MGLLDAILEKMEDSFICISLKRLDESCKEAMQLCESTDRHTGLYMRLNEIHKDVEAMCEELLGEVKKIN